MKNLTVDCIYNTNYEMYLSTQLNVFLLLAACNACFDNFAQKETNILKS